MNNIQNAYNHFIVLCKLYFNLIQYHLNFNLELIQSYGNGNRIYFYQNYKTSLGCDTLYINNSTFIHPVISYLKIDDHHLLLPFINIERYIHTNLIYNPQDNQIYKLETSREIVREFHKTNIVYNIENSKDYYYDQWLNSIYESDIRFFRNSAVLKICPHSLIDLNYLERIISRNSHNSIDQFIYLCNNLSLNIIDSTPSIHMFGYDE